MQEGRSAEEGAAAWTEHETWSLRWHRAFRQAEPEQYEKMIGQGLLPPEGQRAVGFMDADQLHAFLMDRPSSENLRLADQYVTDAVRELENEIVTAVEQVDQSPAETTLERVISRDGDLFARAAYADDSASDVFRPVDAAEPMGETRYAAKPVDGWRGYVSFGDNDVAANAPDEAVAYQGGTVQVLTVRDGTVDSPLSLDTLSVDASEGSYHVQPVRFYDDIETGDELYQQVDEELDGGDGFRLTMEPYGR